MKVSGVIKEAKGETPLPEAKLTLFVGENELAVFYSDQNGLFEHTESESYIGETLVCTVERNHYQPQRVTHSIREEEVALEIEMIPIPQTPPKTAEPRKPIPWRQVLIGVAAAVVVVAAVAAYVFFFRPGAPVIRTFTAEPPGINEGESAQLAWDTSRAQSVYLVDPEGRRQVPLFGSEDVNPVKTTEYRLIAVNNKGEDTKECTVFVGEDKPHKPPHKPPVETGPRILYFKAEPTTRVRKGKYSLLSWKTEDAAEVYLDDENVRPEGSRKVFPYKKETQYRLTVKNASGEKTETCTVLVLPAAADKTGVRILTFKGTPPVIKKGESSVLSWKFVNAPNGWIAPDVGRIGPESTKRVRPGRTTTYTLTVKKNGTPVQQSFTVTVEEGGRGRGTWQFEKFPGPGEALRFLNDPPQHGAPVDRAKFCAVTTGGRHEIHLFYQIPGQGVSRPRWKLQKILNSREIRKFIYGTGTLSHVARFVQIGAVRRGFGTQKLILHQRQSGGAHSAYKWECKKNLLSPGAVARFLNGVNKPHPLISAKICTAWVNGQFIFRVYHQPRRLVREKDIWFWERFSSPGEIVTLLNRIGDEKDIVDFAETCAVSKNRTVEYLVFYRLKEKGG